MKLNRRMFLKGASTGLAGTMALFANETPRWRPTARRRAAVQTKNTARNLIFVVLDGGPSHIDTFDLKLGSYSPDFLGAEMLGGSMHWPSGIFPNLAERYQQFSLVRSISAAEAVHERALYHLVTAHRLSPALANEIPHFSAVLSYFLSQDRQPHHTLPPTMTIDFLPPATGIFDQVHSGLVLGPDGRLDSIEHPTSGASERLTFGQKLWKIGRGTGDARDLHNDYQEATLRMVNDTEVADIFNNSFDFTDPLATQVRLAINLLESDKGVRAITLKHLGWDHHIDIYNTANPGGLRGLAMDLDEKLAFLLDELAARPAQHGEGTLLDETLIVAMGEFGRTIGRLNLSNGRDHYPYVTPALFAGGGVQGGRVIGASSEDGSLITDPGWNHSRYMAIGDVMATVYSALGIDWTTRFEDTPSGRVFEPVDSLDVGPVFAFDNLFS